MCRTTNGGCARSRTAVSTEPSPPIRAKPPLGTTKGSSFWETASWGLRSPHGCSARVTPPKEAARDVVYELWAEELAGNAGKAKHPKSALQEWAAHNRRAMPAYQVIERSGPDHAMRFTVEVSIPSLGAARGTASSKGEAEKRAAQAFLEEFG